MSETVKKLVKTPKADSAFLYSVLEANEGICFYSTLAHEIGQDYRLIEITYTIEFEEQISNILDHCKKEITLELQ